MPNEKQKEHFIVKFMWMLFASLPRYFAQIVFKGVSGIENKAWRAGITLTAGFISLSCLLGMKWIWSFAVYKIGILELNAFNRAALKAGMGYSLYVLAALPFFMGWVFVREKNGGLIEKKARKKIPSRQAMVKQRLKSGKDRNYLGSSFASGKPFFLSDDERLMHAEVIGSTGTGKTDSVLLPMLAHDVRAGKGAIIIDGKGDRELYNHIKYIVAANQKKDKFLYFSLSHPDKSHTYNPFHRGNATELKDKLIGSMSWSEEFFKKMSEQASLCLLNVLCEQARERNKQRPVEEGEKSPGNEITFGELYKHLTDFDTLKELSDYSRRFPSFHMDMVKMVNQFRDNNKFLSGLIADLYLFSKSEFSRLVEVKNPQIDLQDVYQNGKIVYFQLDLQRYSETAKRMGRMILQDIRNLSSYIQSEVSDGRRKFFPIHVDDAASFLDVNFIDLINKIRASKLAVSLYHQSMGDMVFHRDTSFQQQLIENTNVKIILRQDDPQSVEKLTRIGGTRNTLINTYQTEKGFEGMDFTGLGSVREGQAFRIDPDLIRQLKRGEAVVIVKNPDFRTDYLKLDYFGHNVFVENQEEMKNEVKTREPKVPASGRESDDIPESGEGDMTRVGQILAKLETKSN